MDNEPMNPINPVNPINPSQVPESSGSFWKWIIVIAAIIVIAGLAWYFYHRFYAPEPLQYPSTAQSQPQSGAQQPAGELTGGDTISDIASDLNQMPDDSAVGKELDSLNQDLQNF